MHLGGPTALAKVSSFLSMHGIAVDSLGLGCRKYRLRCEQLSFQRGYNLCYEVGRRGR